MKIFKQSQTLFMQIPITKAAESSGTCLTQQFSFTKVRERWASGPVTFVSHHRLVLSSHSGLQGIALLGVPLNPQLTGASELSLEGNGIREMGREWPVSEIVSELANLWETR